MTLRPDVVFGQAKMELAQTQTTQKADEEAMEKELLPPLVMDMPKAVEIEPRFDLSVVNAPAAQVFMALVTGTPYNMLVTPEVSGQITIRLKDVTVKEALDSIRELFGYEYTIKGNRISILPNTLQTKVFQMNYLATKRMGSSEVRVVSGAGSASSGSPSAGASGTAQAATGAPTGAQTGTATGGSSGATARVSTTTNSDFWASLTASLTTIVGTGEDRSIVINSDSGMILVRALPRELRAVESYLKATQLIVERQVIIEAKIIDVTLSQDYQAGVNWGAFKTGPNSQSAIGSVASGTSGAANNGSVALLTSASGAQAAQAASYKASQTLATGVSVGNGVAQTMTTANSSSVLPGQFGAMAAAAGKGFFGLALQTANFAALLNFLESQGSVSVLSSPRIATLNNQQAVLKVGTDDLFVTNVTTTTTTGTTGNVVTPTVTLQSYFSGISLDVTPQIDDNDNIILHIHPTISVVTEKSKTLNLGASLGGTVVLPLASSSVNETDSIIRAKDGNIVAIGGLMRQEQDVSNTGMPGSSGMGTLGALFGQRGNTLSKRELVILLKPTIVTDQSTWSHDTDEIKARLNSLDPGAQFSGKAR